MRRIFLLLAALAEPALSQGPIVPPIPVKSTLIYNITAATIMDCGTATPACIDNRSAQNRQNNYHSFRASGTGTWSVQMQYADNTPSGWVSYGSTALVTNSSPSSAIGYGIDPVSLPPSGKRYHDFVRFVFTGTATIENYTGLKDIWSLPSAGAISYPLTSNQGGTGSGSAFNNVYSAADAASWSAAVSAAPAGSTLLVDSTYAPTIGSGGGATLSANNVVIHVLAGASIKAGASNLTLLTVTGNHDTVICDPGSVFDGQYSQSGYTNVTTITAGAISNFVTSGCAFNNMAGSPIVLNGTVGYTINGNSRFTNIGSGSVGGGDIPAILINPPASTPPYSACEGTLDNLYFSNLTSGDSFHVFGTSAQSPTVPCSLTVSNTEVNGWSRACGEIQDGALTSVTFVNNYCHDSTAAGLLGYTISTGANGLPTAFGGAPYGAYVHDNRIVNSTTAAQSYSGNATALGGTGLEVFSTAADIGGNVTDHMANGIQYGGVNVRSHDNTINFAQLGISPNANYLTAGFRSMNDRIIEPQTEGIVATSGGNVDGGGCLIDGATITRTPGSWTTDNTAPADWTGTSTSSLDIDNPCTIRGNHVIFPSYAANMLTLAAFGESTPQHGRQYIANTVLNESATAQGYVFYNFGSPGAYAGSNIEGTQAFNVTAIAYSSSLTGASFAGSPNQSFIGAGSGAPVMNPIITPPAVTFSANSGAVYCSWTVGTGQNGQKTLACLIYAYVNTGAATTYTFPGGGFAGPVIFTISGGTCGTYNPTTTQTVLTLPANAAMSAEYCNFTITGQ